MKLASRIAVLVVIMSLAVPGVALAKLRVGTYSGTTSDGIDMSITLNKDRQSGTFTYCEAHSVPFTLSDKAFSVTVYQDDGVTPQVQASGRFTRKNVSGSIPIGGGCNGTPQTFTLKK